MSKQTRRKEKSVTEEESQLLHLSHVPSENHEMEVIFEHEATRQQLYKDCKKNPGHTDFIPVQEFSLVHLPSEYQNPKLVEFVQKMARLTVQLSVSLSSDNRPEFVPGTTDPYPFYGLGKRASRVGSGFIERIRRNKDEKKVLQKDCPCDECKKSGTPTKKWTEVRVVTAAHVIYDLEEARKSRCRLFYDTDSTVRSQCTSLTKAVDVDADPRIDNCKITYVIHDCDDVDKLQNDAQTYIGSIIEIRDTFGCTENERINEMRSKRPDDIPEPSKNFPSLKKNSVDDVKGNDRLKEGKEPSKELNGANKDFPGTGKTDEDSTSDLQDFATFLVDIHNTLRGSHQLGFIKLERWISLLFNPQTSAVKSGYDPSHSLSIVVSHPHGGSKKITVGKVTEFEAGVEKMVLVDSYQYDNATCRGSSGAPVFILGKNTPNFVVHGSALACEALCKSKKDQTNYQDLELD